MKRNIFRTLLLMLLATLLLAPAALATEANDFLGTWECYGQSYGDGKIQEPSMYGHPVTLNFTPAQVTHNMSVGTIITSTTKWSFSDNAAHFSLYTATIENDSLRLSMPFYGFGPIFGQITEINLHFKRIADYEGEPMKPSKIILEKSGTVTLNMGDTLTLNYAFQPAEASTSIKWTSSSKKVATVDENGVVTPVKEGSATITVKTANGKKDTVKIKVVDPFKPSKVILDKSGTVTLNMGETLQLNAALAPETAQSKLAWSSSSKKVATVDENGVVTPVKEGSATITVKTHNGKKDTIKVKVVDPFKPSKVILDKSSTVTLNMGETLQLNAALQPETAQSKLAWSSSSKKVATVDENGVVTPIKEGSATITVKTYNGKKDTVKVKVVDPFKATAIKAPAKLTVTEGETFSPEYKLVPETATSTVKVSSSSSKILKVNADGTVTALKKGSATLTLKTSSGKSCKIKVTVQAKSATPEKPDYDAQTEAIVAEMEVRLAAGQYETALKLMMDYCDDGKWNWITALRNEGLINDEFHNYLCEANPTYNVKFGNGELPDKEEDKPSSPSVSLEEIVAMIEAMMEAGRYDEIAEMREAGLITEEMDAYLKDAFGKEYWKGPSTPSEITVDYLCELRKAANFGALSNLYHDGKIPADVHAEMIRICGDKYWMRPSSIDPDPDDQYADMDELCAMVEAFIEMDVPEAWDEFAAYYKGGNFSKAQLTELCERYPQLHKEMTARGIDC